MPNPLANLEYLFFRPLDSVRPRLVSPGRRNTCQSSWKHGNTLSIGRAGNQWPHRIWIVATKKTFHPSEHYG